MVNTMTTIDRGFGAEGLYGLPSAAEVSAWANELFPDLAGISSNAAGAGSAVPQPEDALQAAGTSPAQSGQGYAEGLVPTEAQNVIPGAGVPTQDATETAPASLPEVSAGNGEYGRYSDIASDGFDWEHPFAYGGSSEVAEPYLKTVQAPASTDAVYLPGVGDIPVIAGENKGYAPVVMSQTESQQKGRKIDAPTSLGGDAVDKKKEERRVFTSRDESIRIGSKTLAQIRSDFPILQEEINGNRLVWLDNGATTQRPKAVIDRLKYYYEHENSNVHRGAHTLAARYTDAYENARGIVRDFIGAPTSEEIIFVRGTTEAINLVANAYVKPQLQPGDEIIVSILEHHANIVPWQLVAQETGAIIKVIPCDETGQLILHEYEKLFTKKTKFVAVTHVSNVLGTVTPVAELTAIAHRHGVRILIDGAQSVAHIPVSVSALDVDFFVFSGHKIFAPTGIGVVYGKKELLEAARPYHGGGNMIADVTFERTIYNPIPNKFEAGTGSIADAVGLGAALQYLTEIGMPCVYRWEHELLQYAMKEMKTVKGLHLIGTALNKASVLSFKLDGYSDEEVGKRLDSYGIAVRTGHHCAQPVLRHFGLEGSVRPTLALYNSFDDIDALVKVLKTFA